MVNFSRVNGSISGALNSTFVTLIPKSNKPLTFGDFRPIALCNLVYKLIAKIIAQRLKSVLSEFISPEQFGFLSGRQIHDALGIAQELLHNIKIKKMKAILLKMDLEKAYDRVNWNFLRLILIRIGIPPQVIRWIMACITSMNIAVLVNGTPSSFFSCSRGIRQGCLLSPLLFILVMDGFSRLVKQALENGWIKGIKLAKDCVSTHILFADDVLVGGMESIAEWQIYKNIIQTFCNASGMKVSSAKSSFYHFNSNELLLRSITSFLPFQCCPLEDGFKYLGFLLNPNIGFGY